MILSKEQREEFERLCKPLMMWLQDRIFHPHIKIILESHRAEIVEGLGMATLPFEDREEERDSTLMREGEERKCGTWKAGLMTMAGSSGPTVIWATFDTEEEAKRYMDIRGKMRGWNHRHDQIPSYWHCLNYGG